MITITLVCASGMSTSMLMAKMKDSAKKKGVEAEIVAMPESTFRTSGKSTDILLLGPQVSYLLGDMKKEFEPKGVKVMLIDMVDYGMMNGEKVLEQSLKLLQ